jgi:hypothetical protein
VPHGLRPLQTLLALIKHWFCIYKPQPVQPVFA